MRLTTLHAIAMLLKHNPGFDIEYFISKMGKVSIATIVTSGEGARKSNALPNNKYLVADEIVRHYNKSLRHKTPLVVPTPHKRNTIAQP
jgi:hypothetical protein